MSKIGYFETYREYADRVNASVEADVTSSRQSTTCSVDEFFGKLGIKLYTQSEIESRLLNLGLEFDVERFEDDYDPEYDAIVWVYPDGVFDEDRTPLGPFTTVRFQFQKGRFSGLSFHVES